MYISHWDKHFRDKKGAKPKRPPFALNWAQFPNYTINLWWEKWIFPKSNIFYTIWFKIWSSKNFTKEPWSENEQQVSYFLKNVVYINKFREQPLLRYSKNIQFVYSTSTIIKKYEGFFLQNYCFENFIKALEWVHFFKLLL